MIHKTTISKKTHAPAHRLQTGGDTKRRDKSEIETDGRSRGESSRTRDRIAHGVKERRGSKDTTIEGWQKTSSRGVRKNPLSKM